jgi:choline dehydrogenase/4-pyridoxate dehydrogenase
MYFTEPESALGNRRIECARGKVIGGSSSTNAMAYLRGNRGDYHRWASYGLPSWSYAHTLPYFRKQESWEGGPNKYRGGDGPLSTQFSTFEDPLFEAYTAAALASGLPVSDDLNGVQQEGFGRLQLTLFKGRRCSAATAYLHPALARTNLRVEVHAVVTRVILEGNRAIAVEYAQHGEIKVACANREIILSGGAINSPQILMLSGIGDPDELKAHGIPVRAALRGVGKNLQDHLSVLVAYSRREPGSFHRMMRADRFGRELVKAYCFGKGFASTLPTGMTAFVKSRSNITLPDIQLIIAAAPLRMNTYLPFFRRAFADGFGCRVVMLRPESRGCIQLSSADSQKPVRIHQNFLSTDEEWATLRSGIRLARRLSQQDPLKPFIRTEFVPGRGATSDAKIDEHIRNRAVTIHHPVGTCKMGNSTDKMAVVNEELQVFGIDALRVVDASVIPDLVCGHINAPVIMIAEKAADLIRGRPPLPSADV